MGNRWIPLHTLIFGLLVLTPFAIAGANSTQKPGSWLEVDTRLERLEPDSAILTLTLTSQVPEAIASIQLRLPESLRAPAGHDWHGALQPHQATQFQWTLTGPIDFNAPIGIDVVLTLPEGDTLDHPIKAEWSDTLAKPASRMLAPNPTTQLRAGEALRVVPLDPEASR